MGQLGTSRNPNRGSMPVGPETQEEFNKLLDLMEYRCLTSAGLAIGSGSKAKVLIANTVTYLNAGIFKTKTTAEVAFTATTHDIAAAAGSVQEACYTVSLASDGTPHLTMGSIATGSGNSTPPAAPSGETATGYVRVAVAAGSTIFDASSDNLDAAHLTVTYVNTPHIPAQMPGKINP